MTGKKRKARGSLRAAPSSIAQEAALKFKQTCGLHAEAIIAAEVRHGPMALVRDGFALLVFAQNDETQTGTALLAADVAAQGADMLLAGVTAAGVTVLPALGAHPVIEPPLFAQSFCRMANALVLARGYDPDRPPHLNKVTESV